MESNSYLKSLTCDLFIIQIYGFYYKIQNSARFSVYL
jgi:hypothetical protein